MQRSLSKTPLIRIRGCSGHFGPTVALYIPLQLLQYIIIIFIIVIIFVYLHIYIYVFTYIYIYICIHTPERNHVSGVYSVAVVLCLQFVLHVMLFPCFVP